MSYINEEYAYTKREIDLLKTHNLELEDTIGQLHESLLCKETEYMDNISNIESIASQKVNYIREELVKKQQSLELITNNTNTNSNNNSNNSNSNNRDIDKLDTLNACEQYESQLKNDMIYLSKRRVSKYNMVK